VVRKGSTASWVGDHCQTTLWQIDKNLKSETGHGAQKPVLRPGLAQSGRPIDQWDDPAGRRIRSKPSPIFHHRQQSALR
jgi:hypothetical protein